MISKITGGKTEPIFTTKLLKQYDISFYRCVETGFIQTEQPYWLDEAYSSAITKLDIGLVYRNELLRDKLVKIIPKHFKVDAKFLDYAGGYGLFTRMMRDKGFDFHHTDIYCQNLFAEYFDLKDLGSNTKFEVVTAFEVFEHLSNPLQEIKSILSHGNNLIFSTELVPDKELKNAEDWWYFAPETGQHIAFYTEEALSYIALKFGYNFYTNGVDLHLFCKNKLDSNPFSEKKDSFWNRKIKKMARKIEQAQYPKRESLLIKDWNYIKLILR